MKPAFIFLFYLENDEHCILEIKRTDLLENADISEIFQWLIIDRKNQHINRLNFRFMDSSGEVQERFFEQGYLKFNSLIGTYIQKFNSGQHQLENKTGSEVPREILNTITTYLST